MGSLKGRRVQVAGDPLSPSATRLAPVVAAFAVGLLNALQSRMNGGLATASRELRGADERVCHIGKGLPDSEKEPTHECTQN